MQHENPIMGGPALLRLRTTLMRAGSSKGAFFDDSDLPPDLVDRAATLLACYGSPDPRQVDGLGGADPLTSKAAIVRVSPRPDADVEYTFCQVGIDRPEVSTGGNCGNMLAGVGPFAILRGMVPAIEPETVLRIYTTNTKQVTVARVAVKGGVPVWDGDCRIAGVPGTGAAIELDFGDCAGAVSGKLLPTGNARDRVMLDAHDVEVSLVDASTPFVFVRAADVGATGAESPGEIGDDTVLMARLELLRGWAAVQLGLVDEAQRARERTPNVPRVMLIGSARSYITPDGSQVEQEDIDVCVRQLAMQRPHKALAVTGAVCAAVASCVEGSVINELIAKGAAQVRLGHPSGILHVSARMRELDGTRVVESARIQRTARLLMDGYVYARRSTLRELADVIRRTPPNPTQRGRADE